MVNGLNNYLESAGLDIGNRRKNEATKQAATKKTTSNAPSEKSQLIKSSSMSFKMDMSRSMQVVENEGKRSTSYAMSMNFSISVDEMGKLRAKADDASAPKSADDDFFSPENTAGRIVDFVKSAFRFVGNSTDSDTESEAGIKKFQQIQTDAVKEGFRQARKFLGKMPDDISSGVDNTYDLVMKGLDDFFGKLLNDDEEEPEEQVLPVRKDPAKASYYSSQSFSLSYQLQIQADGNFSSDELDAFVDSSFKQVQDLFKDFMGGAESGFDMGGLFSLDKLDSGRIAGLLSE